MFPQQHRQKEHERFQLGSPLSTCMTTISGVAIVEVRHYSGVYVNPLDARVELLLIKNRYKPNSELEGLMAIPRGRLVSTCRRSEYLSRSRIAAYCIQQNQPNIFV